MYIILYLCLRAYPHELNVVSNDSRISGNNYSVGVPENGVHLYNLETYKENCDEPGWI